jgi:predicted Rossmann fold nucleotide-binding protein DprA/Smf involved in DNA uptake
MAEGAFPVCSMTDVLVALSLRGFHVTIPKKSAEGQPGADLPPSERALYEALTFEPTSLDELVRITGLEFAELCGGLERLAQAGLARDVGGWWERL